jgi:hypothetical protein
MSTLNKSSIDILSDIGLRQEKEEAGQTHLIRVKP